MVAGLKESSYEERCQDLGLETLESRRQWQDMSLGHKFLGEQDQKLFTLAGETGRVQTRQVTRSKNLRGQFARTDMRKFSFAVRVVENWNSLPDTTKQAGSMEAFRSRIKKQDMWEQEPKNTMMAKICRRRHQDLLMRWTENKKNV